MLPFKLIYDERYDLKLGAHVFPSQKYRLVHDKLIADQIGAPTISSPRSSERRRCSARSIRKIMCTS